ncbi:MAG: hypothetical protein ACRESZ_18745 [Methylococcales bacterium]
MQCLKDLDQKARCCSAAELAQEISEKTAPASGRTQCAKVWIESSPNESDQFVQRALKKRLNDLWEKTYGKTFRLDCLPVPWATVRQGRDDWIRRCHGIVLLYGTKPFDSLQVQRDTIEAALQTARWQPRKALVVMNPPHEYDGDILWFSFSCQFTLGANEVDENSLVIDEKALTKLIGTVHKAALPA